MVATPTIDQLKVACNSNRTEHCFCYLFMQEAAETEMFVTRLEMECEAVRSRMLKYQRLLQEGRWLSPFDPAVDDALQCTSEGQHKDLFVQKLKGLMDF